MSELIIGLAFLLLITMSGLAVYSHGKRYEDTKRLEQITVRREDDLSWTLKHTSVAYAAKNSTSAE